MKKYGWIIGTLIAVFCVAGVTFASSIKSWSAGEIISSSDLNRNFTHLHATMVGGHGARLVNADVSATAAIAHTKLATPALLPQAWLVLGSTCVATPCTGFTDVGFATVTRASAGVYSATLDVARTDVTYAVFATGSATDCVGGANTTTVINVNCYAHAGGAATDDLFQIMIMDNN